MAKRMDNAQRIQTHPVRWRLEAVGIGAAVGALCGLPERSALAVGAAAGRGLAGLDAPYRRIALANIALVFPDWSRAERENLLRNSFAELGRGAVEWARLLSVSPSELKARVEIRGLTHFEKAAAEGRGVLVATAHYGSWELMRRAVTEALPDLEGIRTIEREDHWAALAAIVDNLIAHETLEGEQVGEIMGQWLQSRRG